MPSEWSVWLHIVISLPVYFITVLIRLLNILPNSAIHTSSPSICVKKGKATKIVLLFS